MIIIFFNYWFILCINNNMKFLKVQKLTNIESCIVGVDIP